MSEVKLHRSEDDAWTVLKGRVYNITRYLKFHPGGIFSLFNNLLLKHKYMLTSCLFFLFLMIFSGSDMLMKGSGKDCSALFSILGILETLFGFLVA